MPDPKRTPLARARASALGSLAMREHSCQELRDKLINKKHQPEVVDALLHELITQNLVSDSRFAESYWRMRSNKGYGPVKITHELSQKGVSQATISAAQVEAELDFFTLIEQVYEKKYRNRPITDLKEKTKRQAFLYRRGFAADMIRHVIDNHGH